MIAGVLVVGVDEDGGVGEEGGWLLDWAELGLVFEVEEGVAVGLFVDDAHVG